FWCVDTDGLITDDMGDKLSDHHIAYARPAGEVRGWRRDLDDIGTVRKGSPRTRSARAIDLAEVIHQVRPTMLIGTSGQAGAFTEPIIREMAWHTDRPIIFPLSSPAALAEATPADLIAWTDGRALIDRDAHYTPVRYLRH